MLMGGMLANYAHTKLIVNKINSPLTFQKPTESELETPVDPEPEEPSNPYTKECPLGDTTPKCIILKNESDLDKDEDSNNKFRTETPNFKLGEPPYKDTNTGPGIYTDNDQNGKTYYFRGAIDNNNLMFAGKKWKILRINGDGTIRIILAENIGLVAWGRSDAQYLLGYTYENDFGSECTNANPCESDYISSSNSFTNEFGGVSNKVKKELEEWYQENLTLYNDKIALGYFCNDTSQYSVKVSNKYSTEYGGYPRIVNGKPSFNCPDPKNYLGEILNYGGVYKLKIGLISADELMFGGFYYQSDGTVPSYGVKGNFLNSTDKIWHTLTPSWGDLSNQNLFRGYEDRITYSAWAGGSAGGSGAIEYNNINIYPVVNLEKNVKLKTNGTGVPGTETNPYIVK